ncbi:uncharacterized protein LOC142050863, partial [Phalacrocorax aristotelis]|uniref:uncharacterized protein LOC142050863 n=1 Tax=Phalacrocorax aristotelis TaxID=126867 RepID=UPI003F4B02D3
MGSPLLGACLWVLCHLLSHLPPAEGAKTMSCGPHSCSTQSCCLAQARDPNGTRGVCGCPPGMTPTLQNTTIICQAPPCTVPTLEEARSKCRDPQGALGNRSCIQKYLTAKCAEPTEEDLKVGGPHTRDRSPTRVPPQKVLPQLKAGAGAGPEGTAALLLSTEALVLQAALGALSRNASANASVIPLFFSTPIMEVSASGVSSCDAPTLELRAGGQRLALACGAVLGSGSSAALALIAYRGEVVLTGGGRRRLNSRLVGAAVEKRDGPFRGSVNVTLQHLAALEAGEEPFCVFWQMVGTEGGWNRSGCTRVEGDAQHSVCSCTHLSTFAILVALHPVAETFALTVVTYVGMSVSLLCLFLAIVTFMLCRSLWSVSVTLHLHLSICLFAAHLLFLVAVTRTANRLMCAITAGFLHYLFLACFAWMFLEGLHLFLTVRNLRVLNYGSAGRFRRGYIYLVGYGVPAIVVGVSAAAYPRGLRHHGLLLAEHRKRLRLEFPRSHLPHHP